MMGSDPIFSSGREINIHLLVMFELKGVPGLCPTHVESQFSTRQETVAWCWQTMEADAVYYICVVYM